MNGNSASFCFLRMGLLQNTMIKSSIVVTSPPVEDFHPMVLVLVEENDQGDTEVDEDPLVMRKLEDSWKSAVLVDLDGDLFPKIKPG